MKKVLLATAIALSSSIGSFAAGNSDAPLWLRYQRISPNGKTIAFAYQGDIYTVPTTGGRATRLTTNAAYDYAPVWSPDSRQIVFSSNREGSDDLYIVSAEGGQAKRLTFASGKEQALGFNHEGRILFSSYFMPTREFDQRPDNSMTQVYSLAITGGRPRLESALTMQDPDVASSGEILYTDYKGYEDPFRKHHTSSIARDIWKRSKSGVFTKLTSFKGEDRNAVWDSRGGFYYLSEQDGTFNIYHRSSAEANAKDKQLTHFSGNPVRFLSRSLDGTLCFGYDGEIYTMTDGQKPRKVQISIVSDVVEPEKIVRTLHSGAKDFSVSPSGDEYAVVVHGDVFVVNVEYGTVKRITNTPEEERNVSYSPNGRVLVYDSQRKGQWQLYRSELVRKADKSFAYAKEIKEEQLTFSDEACFQPVFSPNGNEVAFLRGRNELAVLDVKSLAIRTVVPRGITFSYTDGDNYYRWSRDGKYLLTKYQGNGGWFHTDCALYRADGSGMEVNLTESGYEESKGRFALGDKAVLFISDRQGYRSHGSWGATGDVYLMFLEDKAYQDFRLSKEDKALAKAEQDAEAAEKAEQEKAKEKKDKKKGDKENKDDKKSAADSTKKAKEEPIKFNFENRESRTIRISRTSGSISDAIMNVEGTKLYFVARYEGSSDLWEYDLETRASKVLIPNTGGVFTTSGDGKKIYLISPHRLYEVNSRKTYNFAVEQELKPKAERQHLFDHVWTTMRDKFYDVDLHGVDWVKYRDTYKRFLPYISNDRDFADLLSEMLGELNASHTGARFYGQAPVSAQPTGVLGAFYDDKHMGDGLLILEIVSGSPLQLADKKIEAGMLIEAVNGETIKANTPVELYMNGTVGKRTVLRIKPKTGASFEVNVRPISIGDQTGLLYNRWLKRREALVREWSGGKVGYVYVKEMDSQNFRNVFKDLLGKYRTCESVVVDTRFNGGGWLHEDLAVLLSGKKFSTVMPRGEYAGDDPFMQWNKPSCVLMNEGNYSNGHGFPYTYKYLGIGKLIGTPVAGTMTAVWWERLFTGNIVYGIPQITMTDAEGKALENQQLYPDIEVYNSPEDYLTGYDRQLKRAVEEMLKTKGRK